MRSFKFFRKSYTKNTIAPFHSPDSEHRTPLSSSSAGALPRPARAWTWCSGSHLGGWWQHRFVSRRDDPIQTHSPQSRCQKAHPRGSSPSYTSVVRMLSSSRLKGKLLPLGGWGCERCLRRPQATSPDAARIPRLLPEDAGGALGQGVERELEDEEVDEEVEEEESEGWVWTELNALSSSSASTVQVSLGGMGIQGCQPADTELDFISWGLHSVPWRARDTEEELWLRYREVTDLNEEPCKGRDRHVSSVFLITVSLWNRANRTKASLLPTRFTFGGPLNSWIFISMSLIQPCISSGESVC